MPIPPSDIKHFIHDGFLRIDHAFSLEEAERCLALLWPDTGCEPENPKSWTKPVVRLGYYDDEPFVRVGNSGALKEAFDQLVGPGRWIPRKSLGSFVVRFPHRNIPDDTGWHVDASYTDQNLSEDYLQWRINIHSKGRALLLLFLFTDVGERDAPTRLRAGSHRMVARLLSRYGSDGLSFMELSGMLGITQTCDEFLATGDAGTVYLCHPFLVHAAQAHLGISPKFMAQPPLVSLSPFALNEHEPDLPPVEQAILESL